MHTSAVADVKKHPVKRWYLGGAKVIADDVGYFDEPFFQDGILAQAVDAVEAKGVAYFSAAGNEGNASYDNTAPSFATTATSGSNSGEKLLNFDPSGEARRARSRTVASKVAEVAAGPTLALAKAGWSLVLCGRRAEPPWSASVGCRSR